MIELKVAHIATVDMSLRYMLLNQLLSLKDAGYDVTGISAPGPEVPFIESAGVRYIPVPMTRNFTPFKDLISLWRLFRVMRQERFTIVHTHTPKPGLLGQLAARFAGVPIVVNTVHGFYFHDWMPGLRRWFYITIEKLAALCSDLILSQNMEDVQTAIKKRICPPHRIKYLGNGIDTEQFERTRLGSQILRKKCEELSLPAEAPVVGFVGRLVAEKGILELFQAARLIKDHIPQVRFLIVGPVDADKADAIRPKIAAHYGLQEHCVFTGRRHDMPELYALMNVLVLPSHREGFPRTPMEASLMGVPCVVTDIRGCREAVQHGRNGVLVARGDIPALADAIIDLLTDREKARRMGEEGRRMARQRFDERIIFDKVKAEYSRLLQTKGLAAPAPHPKIKFGTHGSHL